ncbi:hypothetical protein, partial [Curtobacterium sp. PsM8]|uniref:hypothetical protein n=1 Tax=Curtobacterium sp. PsM8 TaxID=3030532 RepID=UPI00263B0726
MRAGGHFLFDLRCMRSTLRPVHDGLDLQGQLGPPQHDTTTQRTIAGTRVSARNEELRWRTTTNSGETVETETVRIDLAAKATAVVGRLGRVTSSDVKVGVPAVEPLVAIVLAATARIVGPLVATSAKADPGTTVLRGDLTVLQLTVRVVMETVRSVGTTTVRVVMETGPFAGGAATVRSVGTTTGPAVMVTVRSVGTMTAPAATVIGRSAAAATTVRPVGTTTGPAVMVTVRSVGT